MLCYLCVVVVRSASYLVERTERSWTSKRQVTHISSTYFYYALVFSVVCMIGGISNALQSARS
jgi:hypothetical protein